MRKIITLFLLGVLSLTVQAQKNTFADNYLKFRRPTEDSEIQVQKFNKKKLRDLEKASEAQTGAEKDPSRKLLSKAKKLVVVVDVDDEEMLSSLQVRDLLEPYEELILMQEGESRIVMKGYFKKDKIKEFIILVDVENEALAFFNFLFDKPILLSDYMENPLDMKELLFSSNFSREEDDNGDLKFRLDSIKKEAFQNAPWSVTPTFTVVNVGGKYGVKTSDPSNNEYFIDPVYEREMIIYGSNPGNTYVKVFENDREYCRLLDKFGFMVLYGEDISPVYVQGSKEEIAAFIVRDENIYYLYECPEKYELKQTGSVESGDMAFRPHIGYRIAPYQLVTLTDNSMIKCVKSDGSVDLLPVRKSKL